jgi:hypothetical protein
MDINIQLFTGSCTALAELNIRSITAKLNKILKKTSIANALIGWNKDADLSEIVLLLKHNGVDVYLWLPVFSELDALAGFLPIIGRNNKKQTIQFDMGNGENFAFSCPAHIENLKTFTKVYEEHYDKGIYDGVFLDKIRYPSFIGGVDSVLTCFCDYCRSKYDLPEAGNLHTVNSINPLGITSYNNLRYDLDVIFKKLFDYKCVAVFDSLEYLCAYFRGKGLKIGFDLFAPFLAYFAGQDYHRLMHLAGFVKPMFYGMTNAPAGLPFEISMYARAFDEDAENAEKRKKLFLDCIGYGNGFVSNEIANIRKIIDANGLKTRLYAGIELIYDEHIAPVTEEYIRKSITNIKGADGIVASWDLNTIPDSHLDCLLDAIEVG